MVHVPPPATPWTGHAWPLDVAGIRLDLPIVALWEDFAIALMMITDLGVAFGVRAGQALAERFASLRPDVVVGTATLGIPLAIEVSRALGLDRYVILQKSPKIHLGDALAVTITSITSRGRQSLLLDRRSIPLLAGKRVLVVDDVVATGSSLRGAIDLVRAAGADVVGLGCVLTEGQDWKAALGADTALLRKLAHIPQFAPGPAGWEPIAASREPEAPT